jgi:pimeloyl-ACP methyl ester carboxylesterase
LGAFAPHVLDIARIRSAPARRHLLLDDDSPQSVAKPAPKPVPKPKATKPDCGHSPQRDQADAAIAATRRFLQAHRDR